MIETLTKCEMEKKKRSNGEIQLQRCLLLTYAA